MNKYRIENNTNYYENPMTFALIYVNYISYYDVITNDLVFNYYKHNKRIEIFNNIELFNHLRLTNKLYKIDFYINKSVNVQAKYVLGKNMRKFTKIKRKKIIR